jgi:transcriptional regulator with XRE-family HTH domain
MDIGATLKRCRIQRKMTLTKLAAIVGLSTSQLSKVENNQRNISLKSLEDVCGALQIPVSVFAFLASTPNELEQLSQPLLDQLTLLALNLITTENT